MVQADGAFQECEDVVGVHGPQLQARLLFQYGLHLDPATQTPHHYHYITVCFSTNKGLHFFP
jgi:hypothetical protein